jgi:choline-sulfatase
VPDRRPNILFLMSDQHRADLAGFAGNDVVRTPVLDELARTGTVFANAYTPSPVCIPARQCMMAGQLPETCDCRRFGEDLPAGAMTFARRLAEYAYQTVCVGKLHHCGQDQMQGWTVRLAPDAHVTPRFIDGRVEEEFQRYRAEAGCGKWTNQKEIERAGVQDGRYQRFDRRAVQAALDHIEDYFLDPTYDRPGAQPLLLKVSLLQPHYPYFTDRETFDHYLRRVPVFAEERCAHPKLGRTQCGPDVEATPRDIRRATAAYYGMVETIDSHYGAILEALAEAGEDLDEWIIVYTSDHGEMLGEHGIWEKTQFYEASARVPLIIRWPARFPGGRVVHENVSLCDLFATLCDLADVPVPDGLDSRSLVPLLEGRAAGWDDEAVSQIGHQVMIKQGALKYCWYGAAETEVLFDLARDPRERRNVAGDETYAEARARFRRRLGELGHDAPGRSGAETESTPPAG